MIGPQSFQMPNILGDMASMGFDCMTFWTNLIFWRYEVINDHHLQVELATQLPNILKKSLHLSLVFLLQVGNLKATARIVYLFFF